ncbi:MAG: glycosyltransferase family A protein [Candidatus Peribacteraceae bacterium]|nr:glycosyltransferase family A protein [Candidatus Peribacteraceae bacterium]
MSQPALSIVIPTHERAETLLRCLRHIEVQTIVDQIEVIVVSDGHDEKTTALFEKQAWRMPVHFLEIEKSQQGTARNRGVKEVKGEYVLFIGDDIFLEPDVCEIHLRTHAKFGSRKPELCAALGFTTWDPSLGITPVMQWLERSGWQFGYPKIQRYAHSFLPSKIQASFAYTSHISLPTDLAKAHPFRGDISLYGWEDIEWGMRLRNSGVRFFYEPDAKATHAHHLTLKESLERMETIGQSLVRIAKVAPEFQQKLTSWRLCILTLLSFLPTMSGVHRKALLRGIKRAMRNK